MSIDVSKVINQEAIDQLSTGSAAQQAVGQQGADVSGRQDLPSAQNVNPVSHGSGSSYVGGVSENLLSAGPRLAARSFDAGSTARERTSSASNAVDSVMRANEPQRTEQAPPPRPATAPSGMPLQQQGRPVLTPPAPHPGSGLSVGFGTDEQVRSQGGPEQYSLEVVDNNINAVPTEGSPVDHMAEYRQETESIGRQKQQLAVPKTDAYGKPVRVDDMARSAAIDRYLSTQQTQGAARKKESDNEAEARKAFVPKRSSRTYQDAQKSIRHFIKKSLLFGATYKGTSFYETLQSDSTLMPNEVSIGSANIMESLREPNSSLLKLVNDKRAELGMDPISLDDALNDVHIVVDAINELDIEVTLDKPPVNTRSSIQVRVLRAHPGRGIAVHPTQLKAFNADFDGDAGTLNLDQSVLFHYPRAMTQLVNEEGASTIDMDFWPRQQFWTESAGSDVRNQRRKDALELLKSWRYFANFPTVADEIIDSFIEMNNMKSDSSVVDFLRRVEEVGRRHAAEIYGIDSNNLTAAARERVLSGDMTAEQYQRVQARERARNESYATSFVLKAMYDFSVKRRSLELMSQYGSNNSLTSTVELPETTHAFVYEMLDITDNMAAGHLPPNFADFTALFNKYFGEVEGNKNVAFRLLADYAKAVRRTDLLTIGSDIRGLFNGRDSVVTLETLYDRMVTAGISRMVSGVANTRYKKLAVTTQMRVDVRNEVPVIQYEPGETEEQMQQKFQAWIAAFIESYNRNNTMLNISQTTFREGFSIERSNTDFDGIVDPRTLPKIPSYRWTLDQVDKDGKEWKVNEQRRKERERIVEMHKDAVRQLASALVKVYGDYTVETLFPNVSFTDAKFENSKDNIRSSHRVREKYRKMTIAEFVLNNRFEFRSIDDPRKPKVYRNGREQYDTTPEGEAIAEKFARGVMSEYDVLMAIADRRSKQFGEYNREFLKATESCFERMSQMAQYSENGKTAITSFRGANGFLSNFHECKVKMPDGITYNSAEAAFQAQKTEDMDERRKFASMSPREAKKRGKNIELREGWDSMRVDVMREVLAAKFANPELRRQLDSTAGRLLVEGNTWGDRFWGAVDGRGENVLGKLLMELRGDAADVLQVSAADVIKKIGYNEYADAIVEMIRTMSPDLFMFYGMNSFDTFVYSDFGQKLLSADNVDSFRSVMLEMQVNYRLHSLNKLADEIEEFDSEIISDEDAAASTDVMNGMLARLSLEAETLGSSSMVWGAMVSEFTGQSTLFRTLVDINSNDNTSAVLFTDKTRSGVKPLASDFWKRRDLQYSSLADLIASDETFDTKMLVIADVARLYNNYPDLKETEVMAQLACHPDRIHTGSVFDMDGGIRSDIDALKESVDKASAYRTKSLESIEKEAKLVLDAAKKDKVGFERFLWKASYDPTSMFHIDSVLAADAISSVYDKTYNDSEKIRQQMSVSAYFQLVSLQRNGGFHTHLFMTDNSVVNMVGYDQMSPLVIARVLGDPQLEIRVYDESGAVANLSRRSLCGGSSIDDVIKYLEDHPRIALQCRRFAGGAMSGVHGVATTTGLRPGSIAGTSAASKIFNVLADRPRFLALAALVTPTDHDVGRNINGRIQNNLDNLCLAIGRLAYASSSKSSKNRQIDFRNYVESTLGITVDSVNKAKREAMRVRDGNGEYYFDLTEAEQIEFNRAADKLIDEVANELMECQELVRKAIGMNDLVGVGNPEPFEGIDVGSIVSYYDVKQQLGGARTSKMIGIEGSETKKNLALKEFVRDPERVDVYFTRPDGSVAKRGNAFVGDLTLERARGKQLSSIAKFLEVKRENGAEKFNAKAKKYGDDGKNSVIKFLASAPRLALQQLGCEKNNWSIEDAMELIQALNSAPGDSFEERRDAAVPILAKALIDADRRMGYIDKDSVFVESDYWNLAHFMIGRNSDDTIAVRSLEQISVALRNRISDEAIESEDRDIIFAELFEIVDTVGTDRDAVAASKGRAEILHEVVHNVKVASSGKVFTPGRAQRQRSSSEERNSRLVKHLFKQRRAESGNGFFVPSRTQVNEYCDRMFGKLKSTEQKVLRGLAYPKNKYSDEEGAFVAGTDRSTSYDFLGKFDDEDLDLNMVVPGPQSMILFDKPVSEDNAALKTIRERCGTALFTGAALDSLPQGLEFDQIVNNAIEVRQGYYIVPFFDMVLNGMASDPVAPGPSVIPIQPDNATVFVEDETFETDPGDATVHIAKELLDRIRVRFSDTYQFRFDRMFPNAIRAFGNSSYKVSFCRADEIAAHVVNGSFDPSTMTIHSEEFGDTTIDLGRLPGTKGFRHERDRFAMRLEEYRRRFYTDADANGIISSDIGYDSIVGFMKITSGKQVVLAPLWAFHLDEGGRVPTTFRVDGLTINQQMSTVDMKWHYSGSLAGQYMKFFEGIGASNKAMVSRDMMRSRELENGLAVDGCYASSSVASRFFASNKRLNTMSSLFMMPRIDAKFAYNFADFDGAFPDNNGGEITLQSGETMSVKDALLRGKMGIIDWDNVRRMRIRYHSDPKVDSLVRMWVDRCCRWGNVNPSFILSNQFLPDTASDPSERLVMHPAVAEWDAFMDTSYNFEDAVLKFFHMAHKGLCPDGIEGDSTHTLFKPSLSSGDEYGVLKMLVPHFDDDGVEYKKLENVYISLGFFGDDFSGIKRVSANAAGKSIDALNVSSKLTDQELSQVLRFAKTGVTQTRIVASDVKYVPDDLLEDEELDIEE